MGKTRIEWCDFVFNGWIGCSKVSAGCKNCYAETLMDTRYGRVQWGKGNPRVRTSAANWKLPLKWNAAAAKLRSEHEEECGRDPAYGFHVKPPARPRVFCASLADWLDEEIEIRWLADLLDLIRETPQLDWLLLTKRPENWRSRLSACIPFFDYDGTPYTPEEIRYRWLINWLEGHPPANVWLGTSVEDQETADRRIPELLSIPARVRFLSMEPLLGPVNLIDQRWELPATIPGNPKIDWVILGGESGIAARPCNVEWMRSIAGQCEAAGVSCFVKQLGAHVVDEIMLRQDSSLRWPNGTSVHSIEVNRILLRSAKGGDPAEWPEDLRVREFPEVRR